MSTPAVPITPMSEAASRRASETLPPAPLMGRTWEHQHALVAGVGSLAACAVYAAAARVVAPDIAPGMIEFLGTATSLWSVWITQRRNVLALPIGIISVALMGWFFLQIGLAGQVLLHWVYYLPVQVWAWWHWARGDGGGELRVTRTRTRTQVIALVAMAVGTAVLGWALDAGWDGALLTYWDASIVAASIVAMIGLSAKRVESWWLWIAPVNISAIGLYIRTDALMFAALYCLFLVMAVVGLQRWRVAARDTTA